MNSSSRKAIRRRLAVLAAALLGSLSAQAAVERAPIDRVAEIRARLLAQDAAQSGQADQPEPQRSLIAQWGNWGNWGNWNNWRNFWRNF